MPNAAGFKDAQDLIRTYWSTNWPSALMPSLPYVWENQSFAGTPQTDYAEFIVRETDSLGLTCGDTPQRFRGLGNVVIFLRGKLDDGAGQTRIYADAACSMFRRLRINNISFLKAPRLVPLGLVGAHYQVNVIAPFQFDFFQ